MGNVYGTGLPLREINTRFEAFFGSKLTDEGYVSDPSDLRIVFLNLTSYRKHILNTKSGHALFTPLKMRDLFSIERKEHTKALLRFCVDTLYEVAMHDYYRVDGESTTKEGKRTTAMDFQLCTGATYILTKIITYIMKD